MKSLWGQGSPYLRVRRGVDMSPGLARMLLFAVLILIGFVFIAGDVGLLKLWGAQRELKNLNAKITELESRNALLSAEIGRLKNDPFTIEKVAREKYGYLKPGDKVYRIVTLPEKPEKGIIAPGAIDRENANP
ncbi:MAG: septum formation initiator family protein [Candidatus Krumholzibacteria bacterium]|nr:septum formation initiator family protein [Candidatus Krumholzibacteria bacterium]